MVHETNLLFTTLGKNLNCAINVYGILMSFILNKHITIFTDNDMYYAFATLSNRSPTTNEHIDTSLIVRIQILRLQLSYQSKIFYIQSIL